MRPLPDAPPVHRRVASVVRSQSFSEEHGEETCSLLAICLDTRTSDWPNRVKDKRRCSDERDGIRPATSLEKQKTRDRACGLIMEGRRNLTNLMHATGRDMKQNNAKCAKRRESAGHIPLSGETSPQEAWHWHAARLHKTLTLWRLGAAQVRRRTAANELLRTLCCLKTL